MDNYKRLQDIQSTLDVVFPASSIVYDFTIASGYNSFSVGPKFFVNGVNCPILRIVKGQQYIFDLTDPSLSGYPLNFSTQFEGQNFDSTVDDYSNGVVKYGTEGTNLGYVSMLIPESEGLPYIYYYSLDNPIVGNLLNITSIQTTSTTTTTLEPIVKLPDIVPNDPASISCDSEGVCVKPTGRGRRSDLRFNPPNYNFLEPYVPTTPPPPTTTTSTTTTTIPPDLNPYNVILYPSDLSVAPERIDNKRVLFDPKDFTISSPEAIENTYDNYRTFKFTQNSQLKVEYDGSENNPYIDMEYVIIGGGGGGGEPGYGGGGGAGAVASGITRVLPGTYVVVVGDGGSPNRYGQNSSFNFNVAKGGGPGGSYLLPAPESTGSTGGAGGNSVSQPSVPLITSSDIFANAGGGSLGSDFSGGAGGGGAGASANSAINDDEERIIGTNGGDGIYIDLEDGVGRYYAAGGGGGGSGILNTGTGGVGGGGSYSSPDAEQNTGSGGAGANGSTTSQNAGSGSSGLVILRYNTQLPPKFDPNFDGALDIVNFKLDRKKLTLFFNPSNQYNDTDTYYVDYKLSSDTNFSPLKYFKQTSNKNYITVELPKFDSYDVRISIIYDGIVYSGKQMTFILKESTSQPNFEVILNEDNSVKVNVQNREVYKNLFLRYSYDKISWSDLYLSPQYSSFNIPIIDFIEPSIDLYVQLGTKNGSLTNLFDEIKKLTINNLNQTSIPQPPDSTVEQVSGGLLIKFDPLNSNNKTFIEVIDNSTGDEIARYYVENKEENNYIIFSDIDSLSSSQSYTSSYNVKIASFNDLGIGELKDLGNHTNGTVSENLTKPIISNNSYGINRKTYNLLIDALPFVLDENLAKVYPSELIISVNNNSFRVPASELRRKIINSTEYLSYIIDLEDNLNIKNISSSFVYDNENVHLGVSEFTDAITFDPASLENVPSSVQNLEIVEDQDLYKISYDIDLSWDAPTSDGGYDISGYELLAWVFDRNENIPDYDSEELLSRSYNVVYIPSSATSFTYNNKNTLSKDIKILFGLRAINEQGQGPIEYIVQDVDFIKSPSPPKSFTVTVSGKRVTLSWSPSSRLGSFKEIAGFRIRYTDNPKDALSRKYIDFPADARVHTFTFNENGKYHFLIATIGSITDGGQQKKYIGPYKYISASVESNSMPDAPNIYYARFKDFNVVEFGFKHNKFNDDPDSGPLTTGYLINIKNPYNDFPQVIEVPQSEISTINNTDTYEYRFNTIPDSNYNISVATVNEDTVGFLSKEITVKSPSSIRNPSVPSISSSLPITNGVKLTISPPTYSGWSTEFFDDNYDSISSYVLRYSEKNNPNTEKEIVIKSNSNEYILVGLDPSKEYVATIQSKNSAYYSDISEPYDIGSPIQGLSLSINETGEVVVNGNDSEQSFNNALNPNIVFYYGQSIPIQYNIPSRIYFDSRPSVPYSSEILCLKQNKTKPFSRSKIIDNSLTILDRPDTKVINYFAPGRYYYTSGDVRISQLNFGKFSYSIPSSNYLLIKPLRVDPTFSSDGSKLNLKIHQSDFVNANIEKYVIKIRSSSRDEELEQSTDMQQSEKVFTIDVKNEKQTQDLIQIVVFAYTNSNELVVKSEQIFIQCYDFPHDINNLSVQATNCSQDSSCDCFKFHADLSINVDILDTFNFRLVPRNVTHYSYGACFYDEEPIIEKFILSSDAGIQKDIELLTDKFNNSYTKFLCRDDAEFTNSLNSSERPPYLSTFYLKSNAVQSSQTFSLTMQNSLGSSKSSDYKYDVPYYISSGYALICNENNTPVCVPYCNVKKEDDVIRYFGLYESDTSSCEDFPEPNGSEEIRQEMCGRTYEITTTPEPTTTPELEFPLILPVEDPIYTTTTTTTTLAPVDQLPIASEPSYLSIQEDFPFFDPVTLLNNESNRDNFFANNNIQSLSAVINKPDDRPIINTAFCFNGTSYFSSNLQLVDISSTDIEPTLIYSDVLIRGATVDLKYPYPQHGDLEIYCSHVDSNKTTEQSISSWPRGNKHYASFPLFTHAGKSCSPYRQGRTSTMQSIVFFSVGDVMSAVTYLLDSEETDTLYIAFILGKRYAESLLLFLGLTHLSELSPDLDLGELDGGWKYFPINYRQVTTKQHSENSYSYFIEHHSYPVLGTAVVLKQKVNINHQYFFSVKDPVGDNLFDKIMSSDSNGDFNDIIEYRSGGKNVGFGINFPFEISNAKQSQEAYETTGPSVCGFTMGPFLVPATPSREVLGFDIDGASKFFRRSPKVNFNYREKLNTNSIGRDIVFTISICEIILPKVSQNTIYPNIDLQKAADFSFNDFLIDSKILSKAIPSIKEVCILFSLGSSPFATYYPYKRIPGPGNIIYLNYEIERPVVQDFINVSLAVDLDFDISQSFAVTSAGQVNLIIKFLDFYEYIDQLCDALVVSNKRSVLGSVIYNIYDAHLRNVFPHKQKVSLSIPEIGFNGDFAPIWNGMNFSYGGLCNLYCPLDYEYNQAFRKIIT